MNSINEAICKPDHDRVANLEARLVDVEFQLGRLAERNRRVEANKAWETSGTRLVSLTVITYVTMVLVFSVLGSAKALLDALVPTTGFFLSTLSLPLVRRLWEGSRRTTTM
jgi:hypothetical protein